MLVMVKRAWKSSFRRSVRDKDGNILRVLEFQQGAPLEIVDEADLAAIKSDLGHALLEVHLDDKDRPREGGETSAEKPNRGKRK